jgi:hypothetical protein
MSRTTIDVLDELDILRPQLPNTTNPDALRDLKKQISDKQEEFMRLYELEELEKQAEIRRAGALQYRRVLPKRLL